MIRRATIVIVAFVILLGLVVWAVLSGRRVGRDDVPEVTIRTDRMTGTEATDAGPSGKDIDTATPSPPPAFVADSTSESNVPADPRPVELPANLRDRVARFKSASVPIEVRRRELAELARQGGSDAAQVLMALGRDHTYLNAAAVRALGSVNAPGVGEYLRGRLTDGDPLVVVAAVRSLAKQEGEAAVPEIAGVLKRNRERPDGFQDTVCGTCVETLGTIGSAKGIPVLAAELEETVGPILQHDYGSKVVAALRAIHHADARPVLEAYIARLSKLERSAPDNPLGKRYIEGKIKEARDAANALGSSR